MESSRPCRVIKEKAGQVLQPDRPFITRQRPTFPLPHSSSIIGLGGLNFRVRDGNGCGPSGKATGNTIENNDELGMLNEELSDSAITHCTFHISHSRGESYSPRVRPCLSGAKMMMLNRTTD